MVAVRTASGLVEGLTDLAHALDSLDLRVARGVEPAVVELRDGLSRSVRSYLLPRSIDPDLPLCVVLAGPTGSGKSTLANSLAGFDLSQTGPIRPTTTAPVVLTSDRASASFESIAGIDCEIVTGVSPVLDDIALIDTPDIDSTSREHRLVAESMIDSADVVVFITSALRYADEVPWAVLRRAVSRGAPVMAVLNRLSPNAAGALVDLKQRLAAAGLDDNVVRISEHHLPPGAQSIPALAVRSLRRKLLDLASDRRRHQQEIFARVMDTTLERVADLADAVDKGRDWAAQLEDALGRQFAEAVDQLDLREAGDVLTADGAPPRGEWRARRWLKKNGLDERSVVRRLKATRHRLVALIEDQLGSMTLRPGDLTIELSGLGAPLTPAAMRRGIRAIVAEWFEFARRTVTDTDPRWRHLATAVVVDRALLSGSEELAESILGDSHAELSDRARRELLGRLQSLYEAAARRAFSQLAPVLDDPHAGTILRRRGQLVARSYFADA